MNFKKWKIKTNASPYREYGEVFKVSWFAVMVAICLATPATNWAIPFFKKLDRYEALRINIHNKVI